MLGRTRAVVGLGKNRVGKQLPGLAFFFFLKKEKKQN